MTIQMGLADELDAQLHVSRHLALGLTITGLMPSSGPVATRVVGGVRIVNVGFQGGYKRV